MWHFMTSHSACPLISNGFIHVEQNHKSEVAQLLKAIVYWDTCNVTNAYEYLWSILFYDELKCDMRKWSEEILFDGRLLVFCGMDL